MPTMRPACLADNTRVAPIVAAFLLCFAVLLYAHQFAGVTSGSDTLAATATGHSSHADGKGSAGGHTQHGGYLPASLEEDESSDEGPVNAKSLTALLLVVFFGAVLGLPFGGWMWRRDGALLLSERRLASITHHLQPEPASSRLSVFLL